MSKLAAKLEAVKELLEWSKSAEKESLKKRKKKAPGDVEQAEETNDTPKEEDA